MNCIMIYQENLVFECATASLTGPKYVEILCNMFTDKLIHLAG